MNGFGGPFFKTSSGMPEKATGLGRGTALLQSDTGLLCRPVKTNPLSLTGRLFLI